MPYYWRRRQRWRKRYYPRRFRTWRTRPLVFRTWRNRRRRRKPYRRRVRKRLFKRKLQAIRLKQFQPDVIRRCTVSGIICLFQGSPERANHNYVQYIYGYVPVNGPGGGGWTLMIESLSSLWEDWQHLKNVWSTSNAGLPLVRYRGATLTFFQSPYTDYIVKVHRCYPMTDTKYTHADSAPSRMLIKKKTIKVPSLETRKKRRPYKKIRVPPPAQMENKWYFQKDICDIPLLMIQATAVDFRYPFAPSSAQSNNVTLLCLNITLFQNSNFDNPSITQGYFPKPGTYLYSTTSRSVSTPNQLTKDNLIYLGNTKDYTLGKNSEDKFADWGNPFMPEYIHGEKPVFTNQVKVNKDNFDQNKDKFHLLEEDYFFWVRYNPEKDTGDANTVFLQNNYVQTNWHRPENPNLIMEGFPLYDMLWGFTDWERKLHDTQDIDNKYIVVIQTQQFDDKKGYYVLIDPHFKDGKNPYDTPLTNYNKSHWNICSRIQEKPINDICLSGPGSPKPPYGNYMQAKMHYKFYFNWGGCPKTLEKPYDPCSQPTWNIPRNLNEGIQIQNPETQPQTELQKWDWRRDYITPKAIERISSYTPINEDVQIFTGTKRDVPIFRQTPPEDTSSEEEKEETPPIQEQINKLKRKQQQLKLRILKRLKTTNI
nr:MAG: ORF1 [TTV-like mini virus]